MNFTDDETLWRDWKEHYRKSDLKPPFDKVTKDGIIDPSSFQDANPRILFILRETNDFEGGDLRTFLRDHLKYQMWRTLARWAMGIHNRLPEYTRIDDEQLLHKALRACATINLKKVTGGSSANLSSINAFARHDRELLLRQIHLIKPDTIVACGTFDVLIWLLNLPCDLQDPWKKVVSDRDNGWIVVPMRHPAMSDNRVTYEHLRNLLTPAL